MLHASTIAKVRSVSAAAGGLASMLAAPFLAPDDQPKERAGNPARAPRKGQGRKNRPTPLRRTIVMFSIGLVVLVGGTWTAIKHTTDYLLEQSASSAAHQWAQFLLENVTDLEQIASGEPPSATSMTFFQMAQRSKLVFRYEIFNPYGLSQIAADRRRVAVVEVPRHNPAASQSVALRRPVVAVKEGVERGWPAYFAVAYAPVINADHRPIAAVAAYVDQTEERDRFSKAFLLTSVALCLLTGVSFMFPVRAWYRRTREKQQADSVIDFLTANDALTRLANRISFVETLRRAIAALPHAGSGLAVHYIDVAGFKDINHLHGRKEGDTLLMTFAERLRQMLDEGSLAARLGGDEFAVLQSGVRGKADAADMAQRIVEAFAQPVRLGNNTVHANCNIGIVWANSERADAEQLMSFAELAMKKGTPEGGGRFCFFTTEMDTEAQARLQLEAKVRQATADKSFELAYQGIFAAATGKLIGFEALLRMPDASGQSISPALFVPVAEKLGLINQIGAWVMDEACRFVATWPKGLFVAVNLSPVQFTGDQVSTLVADCLRNHQLEPGRLEVEVTESLLLEDADLIMSELRKLKSMGVRVAMDDFGTGYSSLSYLWQFPFDKLKIDRSFISAYTGKDSEVASVLRTIVALGRALKMRVVVEGVETEEQVTFIRELGCDQAQGYYFAKPISAKLLTAALGKRTESMSKPQERVRVASRA